MTMIHLREIVPNQLQHCQRRQDALGSNKRGDARHDHLGRKRGQDEASVIKKKNLSAVRKNKFK